MHDAKLLGDLNESLHELSQPMTVLLCTLEYGESLDSVEEMKRTLSISREACKQIRKIASSIQSQLREEIEERAAKKRALI